MIPIALFLACAGLLFFSLIETAFGLLMRLPERLEAERDHDHSALAAYLEDPLRFFIPVRLLRGTMLVVVMALLAQTIGTGWPRGLFLFGTGAAVVVVLGQVLPALIVRRAPERYLEVLLPPFTIIANLVGPLTAIVRGWLGAPASRAGGDNGNGNGAADDADGGGEPSHEAESRLLRSVVDFGNTLVREVMTPRPDIVAIQASATIDDLRALVSEEEYSRLPVYDENLDNIVGLIVVKDLIQMTEPSAGGHAVTSIMRPASFVPETKRVADLLREFQQSRAQVAIAVDEHGGTAGLVTIEDVVEELVGEIRDEYDSETEPIVHDTDGAFLLSAKADIDDMTEQLGLEIEEGGFETVGGYVLSRVGRVPAVGERFRFDGLDVEILEAERRRIHKVRVRRVPNELEGSDRE